MKKLRLGVNIDHFATLRNQRKEVYIDLIDVAKTLKKMDVNSITVHLREDERHIKDNDLENLVKANILPINLEMAPTNEIEKFVNTKSICMLHSPEKSELTTERGLDVKNNLSNLESILFEIKQKKQIRTSLFIEPDMNQIKLTKKLGVNAIEIHTGKYSNLFEIGKYDTELKK